MNAADAVNTNQNLKPGDYDYPGLYEFLASDARRVLIVGPTSAKKTALAHEIAGAIGNFLHVGTAITQPAIEAFAAQRGVLILDDAADSRVTMQACAGFTGRRRPGAESVLVVVAERDLAGPFDFIIRSA